MTLGIAVLALAAAVGGLVASTAIKSPAQVAAETKSPAATLLTAPVQRGVVSQTVLAQGVAAEPSEISGPPVFGTGGTLAGSGAGAPQPIVTRIFLPAGSTVRVFRTAWAPRDTLSAPTRGGPSARAPRPP
jgi:HlyD family secretion protein